MIGERYLPRPTMHGGLRALGASFALTMAIGSAAVLHRVAGGESDYSLNPAPIAGDARPSVLNNILSNVVRLDVSDRCFNPPGGRIRPFPVVELSPQAPIVIEGTFVTKVTQLDTGETHVDQVASHTGSLLLTAENPHRMSSFADSQVPQKRLPVGVPLGFEIHDTDVDGQPSEQTLRGAGQGNLASCDI